ncbi:MAG: protein kinase [Calothrix sp. MO_167.B42]|nr:protein kinase [Calothrix sp. MO_167.B42]
MVLNNRYRVIHSLGSGGFGETFLAEDTQMPSQRRCVIKQLRPIQDNPQVYELVKQRFQREAAILEELGEGSSRIPRLYAYFTENSQFYLVQEYIEGQTLTTKLQTQGVMSEVALKQLLINILPILDYVHSKGIVHRDIKPDNIIIQNRDGKPILIDFGAVKETLGTIITPSGNSTKSIVIGTPGFMPSEQSVGRPMFASDIYSLGLTAIYLLTGKMPQELATDPSTGGILWRQYAPNLTPTFGSVLDRAIQFNARDRFASATEMLQVLQTGSFAPATPTVPDHQNPLSTVPPSISPTNPNTIPISSSYSQPSVAQHSNSNKGLILGSIIAGGLIGASVVIGFAINRPSTTPQNQLSVVNTPTNTPTPSITQSPPLTTPKPIVTALPSPTPSPIAPLPIDRVSPVQAIQDYYFTINRGEYQTAWNQLSPNLQNNKRLHPKGYLSFIDWWGGKVQSVDIDRVNPIQESTDAATVDAQLLYLLKTGKSVKSLVRFSLVWDISSNRWVVVDVQ